MASNSGLPELERVKTESRVNPTFAVKPGHDGDGGVFERLTGKKDVGLSRSGMDSSSSLRAERSNPAFFNASWIASSLTLLAMTGIES
jgi:hypothetical protein